MAEIGLEISREHLEPLTTGKVQAADVVITMGCGGTCPIFPGKRYLDWDLSDPAGLPVDEVRPIPDEIRDRVLQLLAGWHDPLPWFPYQSASALSRAMTSGMVAPGAVRVAVHLATHSSVSSWKVSRKWRRPRHRLSSKRS